MPGSRATRRPGAGRGSRADRGARRARAAPRPRATPTPTASPKPDRSRPGAPSMPHRLTALPVLPDALAPLGALARGLAAEWDDQLAGLFRALAPESGATAPLVLLAAATPARLQELAADAGYVEAVAAAAAREAARLGAAAAYGALPAARPRQLAY